MSVKISTKFSVPMANGIYQIIFPNIMVRPLPLALYKSNPGYSIKENHQTQITELKTFNNPTTIGIFSCLSISKQYAFCSNISDGSLFLIIIVKSNEPQIPFESTDSASILIFLTQFGENFKKISKSPHYFHKSLFLVDFPKSIF